MVFQIKVFALQSNQRVDVVTWHGGQLSQVQSLKSHTRVVTDLNWHQFDPNILASCSVDTFIHIWDIRDVKRPVLSLSAVGKLTIVFFIFVNRGIHLRF